MSDLEKTGEKIVSIIKNAGDSGISILALHKKLGGTCDCEAWINTLLKSKVIEEIGRTSSGARIVRYKK